MKTKLIVLGMAFMFVATTSVLAQNSNGEKSNDRQNKQREFPSKEMIKEYSLTTDQVTKLKKVSADFTKKREALRTEMKKETDKNKDDKQARPSEESMKKLKTMTDDQNKAIRDVLTKEQQKKWDKAQAERAEKMKNARNNGNRQRSGNRPANNNRGATNNGPQGNNGGRPGVSLW